MFTRPVYLASIFCARLPSRPWWWRRASAFSCHTCLLPIAGKIVGRRSSPPFPFLGGKDDRSTTLFCSETPRRFTHRAAHAACSCEIRPQTGQLSLPSRSVATNSGGQQRGHRPNPNSPPSVAWAIRRSFSASQRNFPSRAGASPVAERISRAARTFSETTVIERSAECRASMSMIID